MLKRELLVNKGDIFLVHIHCTLKSTEQRLEFHLVLIGHRR